MQVRTLLPVLVVGVASLSCGAIFARLASPASSLVIAFWRCAIAAGIVGLWAAPRVRAELAALSTRERLAAVAAGTALALHFHTWIASLALTSVAASCVLVATTPVWTAVLTPWLSRDRLTAAAVVGIGIASVGATVIGWGDFEGGPDALLGDALALAGAIFAALYVLAGRHVRPRLSLASYLTITYGTAALWLGAAGALTDAAFGGHEPNVWWALLGLALVPQLVGHSILNWSLRFVSANTTAVATLCEPLFATGLAWWLFAEVPGASIAIGGSVLVLGVALAIRGESAAVRRGPSAAS